MRIFFDLCLDVEKVAGGNLQTILKPCESGLLKAYQVGVLVNNPKNNTEACIVPSE